MSSRKCSLREKPALACNITVGINWKWLPYKCISFQQGMKVAAGEIEVVHKDRVLKKQQDEEKKLAEMMIPKKKKQLYNKIVHSRKTKAKEVGKRNGGSIEPYRMFTGSYV